MSGRSVAVLVSGGLDSAVLLATQRNRFREIYPIYISQGLAWESVERFWLTRFLKAVAAPTIKPLTVLSVPMKDIYGAHWSVTGKSVPGARTRDEAVYLPGRNLTLTVKAGTFCALNRIPRLLLGSLGQNPFPDASPAFFKRWGAAMSQGLGWKMSVEAPYRSRTKAAVIRQAKDLPLDLTFSCIAPKGRTQCGRCNKCAERKKAFREAGIQDKTHYAE